MTKTKELIEEDIESDQLLEEATKILNLKDLIIFNDNKNSMDFIIRALKIICKHSDEQSNQIALIAHYRGSCVAKVGDYETLLPMCQSLIFNGITAEIK